MQASAPTKQPPPCSMCKLASLSLRLLLEQSCDLLPEWTRSSVVQTGAGVAGVKPGSLDQMVLRCSAVPGHESVHQRSEQDLVLLPLALTQSDGTTRRVWVKNTSFTPKHPTRT